MLPWESLCSTEIGIHVGKISPLFSYLQPLDTGVRDYITQMDICCRFCDADNDSIQTGVRYAMEHVLGLSNLITSYFHFHM